MAITGGKIVAAGTNAQMAREIQPVDQSHRFKRAPGDPRIHRGTRAFHGPRRIEDDVESCATQKTGTRLSRWWRRRRRKRSRANGLSGAGWHQEKWDVRPSPNVNGFPVNSTLNAVSPNNPVFLEHVSGHAAFVNDAALKKAGITRDTPNPPGGDITKDCFRPADRVIEREGAGAGESRARRAGGEGDRPGGGGVRFERDHDV